MSTNIDYSKNDAEFNELLTQYNQVEYLYKAVIEAVRARLETIGSEFNMRNRHNPIHHIETRIKSPQSIRGKLAKAGLPITMDSAKKNLRDIAGVRVVCFYTNDIFTVANLLKNQDDIELIEEKNYISRPKENGYRSLHLVLDVPIFLLNQKKYRRVEVQFRTMAMDFWASLEHKVRYKKNVENTEKLNRELKECADMIALADERMMQIRTQLESDNKI